jgi:hypothetical protein
VARYDYHFYFPVGVIPFESDGYRSEDGSLHDRIDRRIAKLLTEWSIPHCSMSVRSVDERRDLVMQHITQLRPQS